jgi:transcription initiation factor IIF auxiliary subunit
MFYLFQLINLDFKFEKKALHVIIEVGHKASLLKEKIGEYTHKWNLFVRSGDERQRFDKLVNKVVFNLHETFADHVRVCTSPPFCVKENGYGEFEFPIDIYFNGTNEKYSLTYFLEFPVDPAQSLHRLRKEHITFYNPNENFRRFLLENGALTKAALNEKKQNNQGLATNAAHVKKSSTISSSLSASSLSNLTNSLSNQTHQSESNGNIPKRKKNALFSSNSFSYTNLGSLKHQEPKVEQQGLSNGTSSKPAKKHNSDLSSSLNESVLSTKHPSSTISTTSQTVIPVKKSLIRNDLSKLIKKDNILPDQNNSVKKELAKTSPQSTTKTNNDSQVDSNTANKKRPLANTKELVSSIEKKDSLDALSNSANKKRKQQQQLQPSATNSEQSYDDCVMHENVELQNENNRLEMNVNQSETNLNVNNSNNDPNLIKNKKKKLKSNDNLTTNSSKPMKTDEGEAKTNGTLLTNNSSPLQTSSLMTPPPSLSHMTNGNSSSTSSNSSSIGTTSNMNGTNSTLGSNGPAGGNTTSLKNESPTSIVSNDTSSKPKTGKTQQDDYVNSIKSNSAIVNADDRAKLQKGNENKNNNKSKHHRKKNESTDESESDNDSVGGHHHHSHHRHHHHNHHRHSASSKNHHSTSSSYHNGHHRTSSSSTSSSRHHHNHHHHSSSNHHSSTHHHGNRHRSHYSSDEDENNEKERSRKRHGHSVKHDDSLLGDKHKSSNNSNNQNKSTLSSKDTNEMNRNKHDKSPSVSSSFSSSSSSTSNSSCSSSKHSREDKSNSTISKKQSTNENGPLKSKNSNPISNERMILLFEKINTVCLNKQIDLLSRILSLVQPYSFTDAQNRLFKFDLFSLDTNVIEKLEDILLDCGNKSNENSVNKKPLIDKSASSKISVSSSSVTKTTSNSISSKLSK